MQIFSKLIYIIAVIQGEASLIATDAPLEEKLRKRFEFYADEVDRYEEFGYDKDAPKVYFYLRGQRAAYEDAWELSKCNQ